LRLHEAWLTKAQHDLKSAKMLFYEADPILDTAAYHTQQCAEKALKSFLSFTNQAIIKTHDLSVLVDLCVEIDPTFSKLYDLIEEINPYSVIYRYPAEIMEPEKAEVAEAIRVTEKILSFITEKVKSVM
jgi:HEPN domain-containing protein